MPGGVESMTRAPFVMGKAPEAFRARPTFIDTTIAGVSSTAEKAQYGVDAMPETGENVARSFRCRARTKTPSRSARSSALARRSRRVFAEEIAPVSVPGGKAGPITVNKDEHPRPKPTLEGLTKLKPILRKSRHGDAGNASG